MLFDFLVSTDISLVYILFHLQMEYKTIRSRKFLAMILRLFLNLYGRFLRNKHFYLWKRHFLLLIHEWLSEWQNLNKSISKMIERRFAVEFRN